MLFILRYILQKRNRYYEVINIDVIYFGVLVMDTQSFVHIHRPYGSDVRFSGRLRRQCLTHYNISCR